MNKIINLAVSDFRIIFRDPSLRAFFFLPVLLFALIIWGVPPLVEKYDFLIPYLPLVLVIGVIENTQMFSFISSMVLIDEKETEVAKAYGVVPLKKWQYLVSRFLIPYAFTALLNIILFAVQPFFDISLGANLAISLLSALVVPVYALSVNVIVKNRMQGMVYIKAFNMLVLIPVAAFFVPDAFRHVFGILPTHWIFQAVEQVTQGASIALMAGVGYLFFAVLTGVVGRMFVRRHFV